MRESLGADDDQELWRNHRDGTGIGSEMTDWTPVGMSDYEAKRWDAIQG